MRLLQIFKDATLYFSRSTPNLAKVIPAMDRIDTHLATGAANRKRKYNPSVRAALLVGKKLLNKYYDKSDHSELYRIAMGECHSCFPLFPLRFFTAFASSCSSWPQT